MSVQTPEHPVGQMIWKLPGTVETILHLRRNESDPWQIYTEFPDLMEPEELEMSPGYTTFLALLKKGWPLL
jgi:hypothetical protein